MAQVDATEHGAMRERSSKRSADIPVREVGRKLTLAHCGAREVDNPRRTGMSALLLDAVLRGPRAHVKRD